MGGTSVGRAGRRLSRVVVGSAMLALTLGSLAVVAQPAAASGATLYVDLVGNDSGNCLNVNSPCATISYALTQATNGDTILLLDGTLITDHVTVPGTFTNLTITSTGGSFGPGEVTGNNTGTVFTIDAGANVTVDGLTIEEGANGGVNNMGTLRLTDDTIRDNTTGGDGGGIGNSGTLTVSHSTIESNDSGPSGTDGGGINSTGTITMLDDALVNNGGNPEVGGGLANWGTGTLTDVTVSGNVAYDAGGLFNSGTMTLEADTIDGNTAGGMFGSGGGPGGFWSQNTAPNSVSVASTIIAENTGGDCTFYTAPTDNGFNLDGGTSCSLQGSLSGVDPDLLPLGKYGGLTETMPPASTSSPTVNQVDSGSSGCGPGLFDQRGVARGQGASATTGNPNCTIGAVEYAAPTSRGAGFGTPKNTKLTEAAPGLVMGTRDANVGVSGFSASNASHPQHGTVTLGPNGSFTYVPNSGFAGEDSFTYTITDNWGFASTPPATATINVGFFITNPAQLPISVVGRSYHQQLVTTGGNAPFKFKRIGKLPKGLKLSKTGLISGTPRVHGTSTFQVQVKDKSKPKKTDTQTFMIKVVAL